MGPGPTGWLCAVCGSLTCGGVYVHIALGELNWWTDNSSMKAMVQRSFLFFLGCLGIGLVLLSHEHCESGAAGASHAHGH